MNKVDSAAGKVHEERSEIHTSKMDKKIQSVQETWNSNKKGFLALAVISLATAVCVFPPLGFIAVPVVIGYISFGALVIAGVVNAFAPWFFSRDSVETIELYVNKSEGLQSTANKLKQEAQEIKGSLFLLSEPHIDSVTTKYEKASQLYEAAATAVFEFANEPAGNRSELKAKALVYMAEARKSHRRAEKSLRKATEVHTNAKAQEIETRELFRNTSEELQGMANELKQTNQKIRESTLLLPEQIQSVTTAYEKVSQLYEEAATAALEFANEPVGTRSELKAKALAYMAEAKESHREAEKSHRLAEAKGTLSFARDMAEMYRIKAEETKQDNSLSKRLINEIVDGFKEAEEVYNEAALASEEAIKANAQVVEFRGEDTDKLVKDAFKATARMNRKIAYAFVQSKTTELYEDLAKLQSLKDRVLDGEEAEFNGHDRNMLVMDIDCVLVIVTEALKECQRQLQNLDTAHEKTPDEQQKIAEIAVEEINDQFEQCSESGCKAENMRAFKILHQANVLQAAQAKAVNTIHFHDQVKVFLVKEQNKVRNGAGQYVNDGEGMDREEAQLQAIALSLTDEEHGEGAKIIDAIGPLGYKAIGQPHP